MLGVIALNGKSEDEILRHRRRHRHAFGTSARPGRHGLRQRAWDQLSAQRELPVPHRTRRGGRDRRPQILRRQSSLHPRAGRLLRRNRSATGRDREPANRSWWWVTSRMPIAKAKSSASSPSATPSAPTPLQAIRDSARARASSEVVMLSGDNQRTADAIAREAGIDEAHGDLLPDERSTASARCSPSTNTSA